MIEFKGITKNFGDFTAVDHMSFSIDTSSGVTALLGPNGAGKSTTMRLMTGYLQADAGEAYIDGLSLSDPEHLVEIKKRIGYLPESSPLYPEMLVAEYLEFIGRLRGMREDHLQSRMDEMIDVLELSSHLFSPIGILSKGFRQRVALAGSLIHDPDLVILDEPTSGLDPNQITHIRELILKLGKTKTMLLSTHILQEVEDICERVIIINRGKIVADTTTRDLKEESMACLITVRGDGVPDKLNSLSMVRSVHPSTQHNDGFVDYTCEMTENSPEKLFAEVASSGLVVRQFAPVSRSLREIFSELTTTDPSVPS